MPRRVFLLVGALAACEHSWPAGPVSYGPGPLPSRGTPAQLTYNPGQDRTPTWLPDGSGILYSMERLDRRDHDRCLARIPADGGQILGFSCAGTPQLEDSVDVLESPALGGAGRLAVVEASSPVGLGGFAPLRLELTLGTLVPSPPLTLVQQLPFTSSSGQQIDGVSHLSWLADGTLLLVGYRAAYLSVCDTCVTYDTLETGVELIRVTWAGAAPSLQSLPATGGASSVTAGQGDTMYFTLNGDARLFRRSLSSGGDAVLRDFNGAVARDVAVGGQRLVAVVGGMVYYRTDQAVGPTQRDYGGDLHMMNLAGSGDTVLGNSDPSMSIWFRHPAVSPDGHRLVAEGRPYHLIRHTDEAGNLLYTDTIIPSSPDLYEYHLP